MFGFFKLLQQLKFTYVWSSKIHLTLINFTIIIFDSLSVHIFVLQLLHDAHVTLHQMSFCKETVTLAKLLKILFSCCGHRYQLMFIL